MMYPCIDAEFAEIWAIINEAAAAYHGVVPDDCWHEPYMSQDELKNEISAGVNFWGWYENGVLIGVMGIQSVRDVNLIRHAYVRKAQQGRGIGGALLNSLANKSKGTLLVGTWAAAVWAIRLYENNGFRLVPKEEKDRLLTTYWSISERQRETSVVLVYEHQLGLQ